MRWLRIRPRTDLAGLPVGEAPTRGARSFARQRERPRNQNVRTRGSGCRHSRKNHRSLGCARSMARGHRVSGSGAVVLVETDCIQPRVIAEQRIVTKSSINVFTTRWAVMLILTVKWQLKAVIGFAVRSLDRQPEYAA